VTPCQFTVQPPNCWGGLSALSPATTILCTPVDNGSVLLSLRSNTVDSVAACRARSVPAPFTMPSAAFSSTNGFSNRPRSNLSLRIRPTASSIRFWLISPLWTSSVSALV